MSAMQRRAAGIAKSLTDHTIVRAKCRIHSCMMRDHNSGGEQTALAKLPDDFYRRCEISSGILFSSGKYKLPTNTHIGKNSNILPYASK